MTYSPLIIGIGGGKGGVGKSMVCSNMAIHSAHAGLRTIVVDLDLGAANMHTILGMHNSPQGLGEFITMKKGELVHFVTPTQVEGLSLTAVTMERITKRLEGDYSASLKEEHAFALAHAQRDYQEALIQKRQLEREVLRESLF